MKVRPLAYTDEQARAILIAAVGEGVEFLEPFPGSSKRWSLRCPSGHDWSPMLFKIVNGSTKRCGSCKCWSDEEARRFVTAKFGLGVVFQSPFPGVTEPWPMRCPAGHECAPRLSDIKSREGGLCARCAGAAPYTDAEARAVVITRVGAGVEFLEPYPGSVGSNWKMRCTEGHECNPQLRSIVAGQGICRRCRDLFNSTHHALSDDVARARVLAVLPDAIINAPYPGSNNAPWSMTCPSGHPCSPSLASIERNARMCPTCSKREQAANLALSDEDARSRVLYHHKGVTFLAPYPGKNNLPWDMLCPSGHPCSPTLSHAGQGKGICPDCATHGFKSVQPAVVYDLLGVVDGRMVRQFGIANTKSLPSRLAKHRRSGFRTPPVRVLHFATGAEARSFENTLVALMAEFSIPSCHLLDVRFDGSTEAFFLSDATPNFLATMNERLDAHESAAA